MAHEELLTEFNGLVDQYAKHRDYIDKARAQAAKFSAAVIEKVILDHEVKASTVAEQILPHVPAFVAGIGEINATIQGIIDDKSGADERMEELLLRQAIGEVTDGEFEELSTELRATLDTANDRIAALETDRDSLQAALDSWVTQAERGGQETGLVAEQTIIDEPEQPLVQEEAAAEEEQEEEVAFDIAADEPVIEESPAASPHAQVSGMREDVSAVFEDSPAAAAAAAQGHEDESLIEVADIAEQVGDEPSADVDFGFDEGDDFLAESEGAEVELDLVDEAAAHADSDDEIGVELAAGEAPAEVAEEAEEARRALLLYQEGTAEEQIYPFTGEVLTIGRGRDNDIQIKNDSKVSRFHCRLFRRNGNFYIEDNKSSNGTLVNGELITERRLFGGEEVIIGETFFRFRIM